MLILDTLPPNEYTIIANLLGVLLASDLDLDEQNSLGNFLITVGQAIVTVAAQAANIQSHQQPNQQNAFIMQQIDILGKQVEMLKYQIGKK